MIGAAFGIIDDGVGRCRRNELSFLRIAKVAPSCRKLIDNIRGDEVCFFHVGGGAFVGIELLTYLHIRDFRVFGMEQRLVILRHMILRLKNAVKQHIACLFKLGGDRFDLVDRLGVLGECLRQFQFCFHTYSSDV